MNTLFILQRKLICELYYISVYFLLLIIIIILNIKGGFKCYAVISRDVLGLCLPRNLAGNADASRMYLGKVG